MTFALAPDAIAIRRLRRERSSMSHVAAARCSSSMTTWVTSFSHLNRQIEMGVDLRSSSKVEHCRD